MKKNIICCDAFVKVASKFGWFTFSDDVFKKTLIMPHIEVDGIQIRVNNCPCCGKYVRNIELSSRVLELVNKNPLTDRDIEYLSNI